MKLWGWRKLLRTTLPPPSNDGVQLLHTGSEKLAVFWSVVLFPDEFHATTVLARAKQYLGRSMVAVLH